MLDVTEVYRVDLRDFEPRPFQDRVLELVRLFHEDQTVRLRILGTIAAGEPIEALPGPGETIEVRGPLHAARQHSALLRRYLCPALARASGDAFEIARVITPLLAGLKASGTVPIDLDPWLFAGVSLLIARMGVAAFCAEDPDEDDAGNKRTELEPERLAAASGPARSEAATPACSMTSVRPRQDETATSAKTDGSR